MNEKEHKAYKETYNRLVLDVACAICILQSVKGFLSINISRTYAGWDKNIFQVRRKIIKSWTKILL